MSYHVTLSHTKFYGGLAFDQKETVFIHIYIFYIKKVWQHELKSNFQILTAFNICQLLVKSVEDGMEPLQFKRSQFKNNITLKVMRCQKKSLSICLYLYLYTHFTYQS